MPLLLQLFIFFSDNIINVYFVKLLLDFCLLDNETDVFIANSTCSIGYE